MPKIAEMLLGFQGPVVYIIIFVILLLCGFGVPIPEDITLIAAGILAYYKAANVWAMIVVGLAGVMVGDSAMFFLGRRYGLALTKKKFVAKLLPEYRIQRVTQILHKRGEKILFAARFMPGLRSPLFFMSGALGIPARKFFFYDGMAALISVPAIVYSIYYFGDHMEDVIKAIKRANFGIVSVIVIIAAIIVIKWRIKKKRQAKYDAAKKSQTSLSENLPQ